VEVVESFFAQKASGSVVEVRIKLVNNTLKTQDREETSRECCEEKRQQGEEKEQRNPVNIQRMAAMVRIMSLRRVSCFSGAILKSHDPETDIMSGELWLTHSAPVDGREKH
jgi:exopolysaccharide biosynthesis protein